MEEGFYRKYKRLLEALPDVAECAEGKLVLIGGTALALFHLKHRISVDLDFAPLRGDEARAKEALKGCLSKKGYRTQRTAYKNQFAIQFEDASIKVEIFKPKRKVGGYDEHALGNSMLKVAALDELLRMKIEAYADRKEARDLFDCVFIMKRKGDLSGLGRLIRKYGLPETMEEMRKTVWKEEDYEFFAKVVEDASKASS
ncbi:MAG: nucleotidyl transferase AbiEii/AbiGii toxin family protein [Candidatus Burarchaeum sp.]|nr:nucleotidyl transferase AbiEii/AbiGii toxin family protein [Candidatus Burarchaeum sp.]MDO8339560.1 nucleotidyl transferase AbiEii/AbiGii toxin family protein [Candidatus Burarchaeum sp.]